MTIINVDHYVGRTVTAVNDLDNDDPADGVWEIVLDGDVRIINYAENYDAPDVSLVGMKFQSVVMSQEVTKLYFGSPDNPEGTIMHFDPIHYGINDPAREDIEGTVRPQAGAYALETPPHPDERAAEAAEEPAEAAPEPEELQELGDDG